MTLDDGSDVLTRHEAYLYDQMGRLLNQHQHHTSTHRQGATALKKLQLQPYTTAKPSSKRGHRAAPSALASDEALVWEQAFALAFTRHLNGLLAMKRGDVVVQRLLAWFATFFDYSLQKDIPVADEDETDETPHMRFMEYLIRYLLQGVESKDKLVRKRTCFLIAKAMDAVNEVGEELWALFKSKMYQRLFDKEPIVRVQALNAMARLQGSDQEADEGIPVIDIFMDMLQHDPSAEVRKAALMNIDMTEETLPLILARCRDTDAGVRKYLFRRKMMLIDWRVLGVEQREGLLKVGLTDRDEQVRKACTAMIFENWIKRANSNLLEFLSFLDVISNESMSQEVLKGYFTSSTQHYTSFDQVYWENLTPETAFYVRQYCDFIKGKEGIEKVQESLPEVSQFALYLEQYRDNFYQSMDEDEAANQYAFIVLQLLHVASHLDYADEVGRKYVYNVLRDMLLNQNTAEVHYKPIVLIIKLLSSSEFDFTQNILDIISDIGAKETLAIEEDGDSVAPARDLRSQLAALAIEDDEATSASPSSTITSNEDLVAQNLSTNLKCLYIMEQLLVNLHKTVSQNDAFVGLLNEFIIPAVNSDYAVIQEYGVRCLALVCVLDKDLAIEYMPLFLEFIKMSDGEVQVLALKTAFDLVMLFGLIAFDTAASEGDEAAKDTNDSPLVSLKACLYHPSSDLQTLAVEGFCKLLLLRVISDSEVLAALMLLYFHPETVNNTRLRQCLNYFIQVFAYTSSTNQSMIQEVFLSTLQASIDIYQGLGDKGQMVTPINVVQQMAAWTDSRRLVPGAHREDTLVNDPCKTHVSTAMEFVKASFTESAANVRLLCQSLNKLHIYQMDQDVCDEMIHLVGNLQKHLTDKTTLNALKKFAAMLIQLHEQQLAARAVDPSAAEDDDALLDEAAMDQVIANQQLEAPDTDAPHERKTRRRASHTTSTTRAVDALLQDDDSDMST